MRFPNSALCSVHRSGWPLLKTLSQFCQVVGRADFVSNLGEGFKDRIRCRDLPVLDLDGGDDL